MKLILIYFFLIYYSFACCSTEWNLNPRWTDMGNGVLSPIHCPQVYRKSPAGRIEYVSNWKYSVNGLKFKSHSDCRKFIKRCSFIIKNQDSRLQVFKEKNDYKVVLMPDLNILENIDRINNMVLPRSYTNKKFQLDLNDTIHYFDFDPTGYNRGFGNYFKEKAEGKKFIFPKLKKKVDK